MNAFWDRIESLFSHTALLLTALAGLWKVWTTAKRVKKIDKQVNGKEPGDKSLSLQIKELHDKIIGEGEEE